MRKNFAYHFCLAMCMLLAVTTCAKDSVADNMLRYQRSIGGWPKHIDEVKVDYTQRLSPEEQARLQDSKFRNDATINNGATTKAIQYLLKAYKKSGKKAYLDGGMFSFKDCIMEGGVDFYCPRGWAYAQNCQFYTTTGTAAIWHNGSTNPDYKTVLKNCTFDGYKGFKLGHFHKDAQFYLVDCRFSENMANEDIYWVAASGNNLQWKRRVYYENCHRVGGDYLWFQNNLNTAKSFPKAADNTPAWVFGKNWQPEEKSFTLNK